MIKKNCVICGAEFLIKATGKRVPRLANFPTGTILRRKRCVTCSRECSRKNVANKTKFNKERVKNQKKN